MRPVLILILASLSACTNTSEQELILNGKAIELSRTEVISGIQDCKSANLRPVVINARKKVSGNFIPIAIDVTCAPKPEKDG